MNQIAETAVETGNAFSAFSAVSAVKKGFQAPLYVNSASLAEKRFAFSDNYFSLR